MKRCEYTWENAAGRCAITWTPDGLTSFRFMPGVFPKEQKMVAPCFSVGPADDIKEAVGEIDDYFRGGRPRLDFPLDFSGATDFRKKVWTAARGVGYGETVTYSGLARVAGAPGAARAVGNALGANPLLIIVPCHRVLRSDGGIGGFSSGVGLKKALLALENGEKVDFRKVRRSG